MNDLVTSIIRTWTPILVGAVISWLTARGIHIDPTSAVGIVPFLTAFFSALYYFIVRLLESKFPAFGWLLGQAKKVTYEGTPDAVSGNK